jgi:Flp pilus assembly pilin Flp
MQTRYDIFESIPLILIMLKRICLMVPLVYQKNREKGQGLVEYAFIFVLVALLILVSTKFLAPIIRDTFFRIGNPLYQDNGVPTSTPIPTPTPIPIPTWTFCADEHQTCSFSGTAVVRYGANGTWVEGTFTNGVFCDNSIFGDPLVGTFKSCQIKG